MTEAPTDFQTLILCADEVAPLLDMPAAVESMEQAMRGLDRGEYHQPMRMMMWPPGAPGAMGMMPSYGGAADPVYGLKAGCMTPGNRELGIDMHQGVMAVLDGPTGRVRAIMNLAPVTAVRTAATSAVATRALANPDAHRMALIGAGLQAHTHLAAISLVRDLESVTVWTPREASREAFAERESRHHAFPIRATETAQEAVADADIIVTVTPSMSAEPVIARSWLAPGTHINAVGSCAPFAREIDAATVAASVVIVDRLESALKEAGDLVLAQEDGAIGPDHARGDLGQLLNGGCAGRTSPEELTMFESVGIAVQDLAMAVDIERRAREAGAGLLISF